MKLFIKEHALLIVVQIIQFLTILLIYWLDGYNHLKPALYGIFLGFFFLICYLTYHYISRRQFYDRLSEPIETLDESLRQIDNTPISEALNELLKTQYKKYQQQIKEAERKQEEHMIFIDRWIHQMKTPLSVIELIAKDLDEPESSSMREETDRMKTGLNTILYMARLRTIEQDFHIKPVHLAELVKEVNLENKRFYIRNHVYPQINEEQEGIKVETDEKWLFFIVSQLIHNAVKYSAQKSDHIIISLFERNSGVILEVKDFGVGIPTEDKKRIFDAFYTGENGRTFRESTGVGLFLVKEVTNYLGHVIEFESEVGKGTSLRIIFAPSQNLTTSVR